MGLAIFDLDNTLLAGDSDYLWGRFMVAKGLVDGDVYEQKNLKYYEDYKAGRLDIYEFLRFSLHILAQHDMATLNTLHLEFMQTAITSVIAPATQALLSRHREQGDFLLIITATNRFVTGPIANLLGADDLLATDPEVKNNRYTGEVSGTPCFQNGKVERLQAWLTTTHHSLDNSWFYSDSHNDIPLLEQVTHAVAVDPDETLALYARQKSWPIISLREGEKIKYESRQNGD